MKVLAREDNVNVEPRLRTCLVKIAAMVSGEAMVSGSRESLTVSH